VCFRNIFILAGDHVKLYHTAIVKIIKKVLLIDDDPVSNHLNKALLERLDFTKEIIVKTNGREAILYLQSDCYSENNYPVLILLDLKMPVLDGFDFLIEYDKLDISRKDNIVIVVLTTSTNADDIMKLRSIGKYDLINKPLNLEKLVDIYHRYFRNLGYFKNISLRKGGSNVSGEDKRED
jgi:CheY-like chemotaxis protein